MPLLLGTWLFTRRLVCAWSHSKRLTPQGNPLPPEVHDVLPSSVTQGRRVVIVGDVHGCFDELQDLLDLVGYQPGQDIVVAVGDLVNKGPASAEVLRWFAAASGGQALVRAVRGNHDDTAAALLRKLRAGELRPDHPKMLHSYGWLASLDEPAAALLGSLPFSLRLPAYGALVVHAGLVPGVPLHHQRHIDLLTMRNVEAPHDAPAAAAADAAESSGLGSGQSSSGQGSASSLQPQPSSSSSGSSGRAAQQGEDWSALLAYAQLGEGSGRSQRPASGAENRPPEQQQQQQQQGSSAAKPAAGQQLEAAAAGASRAVPRWRRGRKLQWVANSGPAGGTPWAQAWSEHAPLADCGGVLGPPHVFFGHDARRQLQLESHASGLDAGCVYGGQLCACILPPLDAAGELLAGGEGACVPPGAQHIQLGSTGLPAWLVSVPARRQYLQPDE